MKKTINTVRKIVLSNLSVLVMLACGARVASASGISNFEGLQCVSMQLEIGADSSQCADIELPDCQSPDWFPLGAENWAGVDAKVTSYPMSDTVRYNELDYVADDSPTTPWVVHVWYSDVGVPYGPALPSMGHEWNLYGSTGLLKSVSCNNYGTTSFP